MKELQNPHIDRFRTPRKLSEIKPVEQEKKKAPQKQVIYQKKR